MLPPIPIAPAGPVKRRTGATIRGKLKYYDEPAAARRAIRSLM
jgi:hypothetical protein